MKSKMLGVVAFIIIILSLFAGLESNGAQPGTVIVTLDAQLTPNNSNQEHPDVYAYEYDINSYAVVWQDNRNGNYDIYMYSQKKLENGRYETQLATRITEDPGIDINPKIYNNTIVYQSKRNGNWDIYMYNLTSKVETQITTNTADQQFPEVYGDIIVWQDYRDASMRLYSAIGLSIYIYNLTSHTEQRLPLPERDAYSPAISEDIVVYAAQNYAPAGSMTAVYPYVCSYNLSTGLKTNVVALNTDYHGGDGIYLDSEPAIRSVAVGGSLVAWFEGSTAIGVKDLSSNITWQHWSEWCKNMDIGGGRFVVYQSYDRGYWHLNVYDSYFGRLDQLTTALGHQENVAISPKDPNFVVYQDDRSGLWQIYRTNFWWDVPKASSNPIVGSTPPATSSTPLPGGTAHSGNQDLTIIAVVAIVAIAATSASVFAVTRRKKPKKQELLHTPQNP